MVKKNCRVADENVTVIELCNTCTKDWVLIKQIFNNGEYPATFSAILDVKDMSTKQSKYRKSIYLKIAKFY